MYDRETSRQVESFIQDIKNAIPDCYNWPGGDLFIELTPSKSGTLCGYYLVHHARRCIYWVEKVELSAQSKPLREVRGDISGHQTGGLL